MKTNPTCERPECPRTFSDDLNFCQLCGATLTSVAAPPAELDPYKTVVDKSASEPFQTPNQGFDPYKTVVSPMNVPPKAPETPPDFDALKTMVADPPSLELPSVSEALPKLPIKESQPSSPFSAPATPFSVPPSPFSESANLDEPPPTVMGDWNTPSIGKTLEQSPFDNVFNSAPLPIENQPKTGGNYGTPIGQPFENLPTYEEQPKTSGYESPRPTYQEPESPFGQNAPNNFGQQANQWTPPPAPVAQWQNQGVGQNTPFAPPASQGQNQTLPIISLVFGILSVCCYIGWITGPVALITGYLGMKNIAKDPTSYGGKGLAMAGMIVGGIFTALWLIYWIVIIVIYAGLIAGATLSR